MPLQREVSFRATKVPDVYVSKPTTLKPVLGAALDRLVCVSPGALVEMTQAFGSPLNVVVPQVLATNADALRAVLQRHDVRGEIFYGAKVNKSPGLVRAAVEAGIGVDVSSLYEMRDALRAGIDPRRLCATGPAKTRVFHMALIANSALISVDSIEELGDLESVMREIEPEQPVRVLLRYRPEASAASRFGMTANDILFCLERFASAGSPYSFEGFHFHLGGYGYEARANAVREVVRFVDAARAMGLDPKMIDIGGGLPVQYVERDDYEAYLETQRSDGYRNGRVPGSFYPYGGPIGACEWLDRFLASPCGDDQSIAGYLRANKLLLAIEPGRSLADQTALSVFRIARVKSLSPGEVVIFVEGSSFSACETWFASEFLVDPIHLSPQILPRISPHSEGEEKHEPTRGWIAGHSCLDEDVLTNRLIEFARRPRAGDLLVYANTGGYQMDLLENEFHRHPMPRRISVAFDAAGGMTTSPDDRMENRNDLD